MTSVQRLAFCIFLMSIAYVEVSSWTIDLPEARKYFFNKNKDKNYVNPDDRFSYDNIHGNSLHNTDDHHYVNYFDDSSKGVHQNREKYAESYDHQGYMEKQVHDVITKGSAYLDGLRRSLQNYMGVLENCSRTNFTNDSFLQFRNWNNSLFRTQNTTTELPNFNLESNSTASSNWTAECRRATEKSEYVRRMTDLALWVVKRLEDKEYASRYQKVHEDDEKEENELVLRLAWYLDRIAHYTGYEPNVKAFVTESNIRTSTTPTPLQLPFLLPYNNVSQEVVDQMISCLKQNSTVPATERCRYPLPLPPLVRQMLNITDDDNSTGQGDASQVMALQPSASEPVPDRASLELLVADDTKTANILPPKLTPVKNAANFPLTLTAANYPSNILTDTKSVRKRSVDESPLLNLMKYYSKHKIWVNSNPIIDESIKGESYDVDNKLPTKSIRKRSLNFHKKNHHLHLPEHPLHVLKNHFKKKGGIHYNHENIEIKLLKDALQKIHHTTSLTVKHHLKKMDIFKKVHKRSVHYGKMYKPRVSEDPYQDISYYVKNKKGVEYNYNPLQAAQVRLGLERIFQTGNIEVIRRYGANFNPLDPAPFYSGLMRSAADS